MGRVANWFAPGWTAAAVIEEETARDRAQVGSERGLCA